MAYIKLDDTLKVCSDYEEWCADMNDQCGATIADNIYQEIVNLPTADVVEAVRCKGCKHCYEKRTKRNNQLMRFCMRMDGNEYQVNANDFCSYGTPKERGGEK